MKKGFQSFDNLLRAALFLLPASHGALSVLVVIALGASSSVSFAQTTGQPATTVTPPPTAPQAQPGSTTIGALVIPHGASVPQPNPNASDNAALPLRHNSLKFEPINIYPFMGLAFGYNSNLVGSNVDKVDSGFWVLTPRIVAEVRRGASQHSLIYNGNFGRYLAASSDNYDEHELIAETRNQFTARADLSARAYYLNKSDPRGLLVRAYFDTPDRWNAVGFDGTAGYGAKSAQGRFEGYLGYTDKKYENNRNRTVQYDLAATTVGGRFYYRVSPKTRLLAEAQYRNLSFTSASMLDNQEVRFLAGATWEAAASTTGTVKIGWMKKSFKDSTRSDFSGANFEGALRWQPRTYSVVDLVAERSALDSWGVGIYSIDSSLGGVWTHYWRTHFSTRAIASYVDSKFEGLSRTDRLGTLRFGGFYDLTNWLKIGLDVSHQTRKSDDSSAGFSRNVIMFTLGGTI